MKKIIAIAALAAASIATAHASVSVDHTGRGNTVVPAANAQYAFDLNLAASTVAPQFNTTVVTDAIHAADSTVIASTHFTLPSGVARYYVESDIQGTSSANLAVTTGENATAATLGNDTIKGSAADDAWINVVKTGDLQAGMNHITYTLTAYSD